MYLPLQYARDTTNDTFIDILKNSRFEKEIEELTPENMLRLALIRPFALPNIAVHSRA